MIKTVTESSFNKLQKIFEKMGVDPACPMCNHKTLVEDRIVSNCFYPTPCPEGQFLPSAYSALLVYCEKCGYQINFFNSKVFEIFEKIQVEKND